MGDLYVLLRAHDDPNRHVWKVPQDHTAIVGRREPGVLSGEPVRFADHARTEGLRRLTTPEVGPLRYSGDPIVGVHHDNRVRTRNGHINSAVAVKRAAAFIDDARAEQRPHRIVKKDIAIVRADQFQCQTRRRVAGRAALGDPGHLGKARGRDDPLGIGHVVGCHHHDDFVDGPQSSKNCDRVLEDRLSRHPHELFGNAEAEPDPGPAGKDDSNGAGGAPGLRLLHHLCRVIQRHAPSQLSNIAPASTGANAQLVPEHCTRRPWSAAVPGTRNVTRALQCIELRPNAGVPT